METVNLKAFESLSISEIADEKNVDSILNEIKNLHIEFELNPKSFSQEIAEVLDRVADEFAAFIRQIVHQSDDASRKLGELSLKIVKLCVRLESKISLFYSRGARALSFN
jgi:hypothetical protein